MTYGKHLGNSERKKLIHVPSSSGVTGAGPTTGDLGFDCITDAGASIAKCSSYSTSLSKRPLVAPATNGGNVAEEGEVVASGDWVFVLSDVNPSFGGELDTDRAERAVDALPVRSVKTTCHGRLVETFIIFTFCSLNV